MSVLTEDESVNLESDGDEAQVLPPGDNLPGFNESLESARPQARSRQDWGDPEGKAATAQMALFLGGFMLYAIFMILLGVFALS